MKFFQRSLIASVMLFAVVCGLLIASGAHAATKRKKAKAPVVETQEIVHSIKVVGNKKIEADAILEKLVTRAGQPLNKQKIRDDILALHKTNFFDSVSVDFTDGVLTYAVKERPTIMRILFVGNEQMSTDDLKNVLTFKTYDLYNENLVRESARKLEKSYEDKGYYLARVSYELRKGEEKDTVEVLYKVREYDKVRIQKITFLGNKEFSDSELKKLLRNTQEGGFFSWLTNSGNFKELDFKTDLQLLQYWYLKSGFVKFHIEPPIVAVSEDKQWIHVTLKLDEGKKYKVADETFSGDVLFPNEELSTALTLKSGEVFDISKRNADIMALTEKYQDLGYANVNVVPDNKIDDDNLTVSTNFEIEKGTLVRFGKITISGNTKTRDKVIRRELKIREGELYSGTAMRMSKENVERLGFFEQDKIEFTTQSPQGRPDILDVNIDIKEHPTGQFQLGAGYSTTTKFFFSTSVAETNFLGRGQDLRFQGQMAADRTQRGISISFTDPYAFDTEWSAGGDLYYNVNPIPNLYIETRRGTGVRLGHPISDYTRLFVGYKLEEQKLEKVEDDVIKAHLDKEEGTISSITLTLQRDKRNNRMETSNGTFASWSEEYAGIGGNRNFVRSIVDLRYYHPVIGDLIFRTKAEGGAIWDYAHAGVQRGERFYLGGPNNLRGYPPFDVSPTEIVNGKTFRTGGLHELVYMAELEYPLVRDLGLKLAVFYDAGDAFNKFNEVSIFQDYGWGFRWFSPIGPLRFEWGHPIKKEGVRRDQEFNFTIGPPF